MFHVNNSGADRVDALELYVDSGVVYFKSGSFL